ncbi:MAG: hypothetical protein EOO00_02465 [Chitinophagaceae bacterium]|nr:MAG: hypothetical protein EOO00_02465 [Chitinophagaceae bacterium]
MKQQMKIAILSAVAVLMHVVSFAQCSICSKTASQLGEEAGRGLNGGILYLAAAPFLIISYIGYRWWKNNQD